MMESRLVMWMLLVLTSCASLDAGGEFFTRRTASWEDAVPSGMVLIPQGSFRMGPASVDSLWGLPAENKQVSVASFWMDNTEVTNSTYRRFVYYVRDSIIRERLADPRYGGSEDYRIAEDKYGNPIPPQLNWSIPIPWKHPDANERRAIESIYRIHPVTKERLLDAAQLNYRYTSYDYTAEARHENPSPQQYTVNIYPDETCWVNDFEQARNESYLRIYFLHPGYNQHPVAGVSWQQAMAFCAWRTACEHPAEPIRLPTEAEWEYAARAGKNKNRYPWTGDSVQSPGGCFLANFKPAKGNYTEDGHLITSRVKSFPPNPFGLYDMAGNMAEWTSSAYTPSALRQMGDLNPDFRVPTIAPHAIPPSKIGIRGGSWKDPAYYIRSDIRSWAQADEHRSYIGFRCVRTHAGYTKR